MAIKAPKSDEQIKQDVLRELRWDTRVRDTEIGVTINNGIVTLTGTVGDYAKKLAAEAAAHRVAGVSDVANDISVNIPGTGGRSDTDIAQAVRSALTWDVLVHDEYIHSTVADGWVKLEGSVEAYREREEAERTVRNLAGVRGVRNLLEVKPQVSPPDLQQQIEAALERVAERQDNRIQVTVNDGVVTLSGKVQSWGEKQAIINAVSYAPGVQRVEDQLRL